MRQCIAFFVLLLLTGFVFVPAVTSKVLKVCVAETTTEVKKEILLYLDALPEQYSYDFLTYPNQELSTQIGITGEGLGV